MRTLALRLLALVGLIVLGTAGCTLKATFETTTDTTSNFLSSTTPGAWVTEDGLLKAEHKVTAFTALNQSNIEQDMARGRGEYLASLSSLLGVAEERQESFLAGAQREFSALSSSDRPLLVQRLRWLAE